MHLDLEGITLNQDPYSPHPREGSGLSNRFPRDANVNPRDAAADQDRIQANLGYDMKLGKLDWSTLVSAARTSGRNVRGFLREDFDDTGAVSNADGYRQQTRLNDVYFDTNVAHVSAAFDWIAGVDWLYGRGRQRSQNFEYAVLPNGSNAPNSNSLPISKSTVLTDRRSFAGVYAQTVIRPTPELTLLAGLRLNRTAERRCGGEAEGDEFRSRRMPKPAQDPPRRVARSELCPVAIRVECARGVR